MRCLRLLLLAGLPIACASQRVTEHFGDIRAGMTRDEVVALLGEPSSRWTLTTEVHGMQGTRYQWGDGLSSLASSAVYHTPPERAYSVDFNAQGKVVATATPAWVERAGP